MPAAEDDASSILPASAHNWRLRHKRAGDSSASLSATEENQEESDGEQGKGQHAVLVYRY